MQSNAFLCVCAALGVAARRAPPVQNRRQHEAAHIRRATTRIILCSVPRTPYVLTTPEGRDGCSCKKYRPQWERHQVLRGRRGSCTQAPPPRPMHQIIIIISAKMWNVIYGTGRDSTPVRNSRPAKILGTKQQANGTTAQQ